MSAEMQTATISRQSILALLEMNKNRIQALGVKRLGLFGSFIRGEQRVDSDVDLLVEFRAGEKTYDLVSDVVTNKIPALKRSIERIIENQGRS